MGNEGANEMSSDDTASHHREDTCNTYLLQYVGASTTCSARYYDAFEFRNRTSCRMRVISKSVIRTRSLGIAGIERRISALDIK